MHLKRFYCHILIFLLVICTSAQINDSAARLFGEGIISTGDYESHPCFSPDGKSFYFIKSFPNFSFWTICVSYLQDGKWTQPVVAPFSGKYSDADPYITPDGKKFYFISNRPTYGGEIKSDMDIWVMELKDNLWTAPQHLDTTINSPANEWFPRETKSGRLYFGSERQGGLGGADLYYSEWANGKYAAPKSLGDSINTRFNEFEPLVDYNEQYLVFMSVRKGGLGGGDFYLSRNKDGTWTSPVNLGEKVNSAYMEIGAAISNDGKYFFFSSTRQEEKNHFDRSLSYQELTNEIHAPGNGLGDIYFIELDEIIK